MPFGQYSKHAKLANGSFTSCVRLLSSVSFISAQMMSLSTFMYCWNHLVLSIPEKLKTLFAPVSAWNIDNAASVSRPSSLQITGSISKVLATIHFAVFAELVVDLLELVWCQCKAHCTTQRCSCRWDNLACTDLCLCGNDCENDVDCNAKNATQDSDDDRSILLNDTDLHPVGTTPLLNLLSFVFCFLLIYCRIRVVISFMALIELLDPENIGLAACYSSLQSFAVLRESIWTL